MTRPAIVALMLLVAAGAAAAPPILPHLGELRPDGFVVALETAADAIVTLELARGIAIGSPKFKLNAESRGQRHRLAATGLSPRERVRYRVLVDGVPVAVGSAQAGPADDATTLDFVVYGDTRSEEVTERAVVLDAIAGAPELALHTGDLVARGEDDGAWRRFFEVEQPLLSEVPLYLAVGNHELIGDEQGTRVRRYLPLPPYGDEGVYYAFRVGPARFIVLDSDRHSPDQTAWLERTLVAAGTERGHPHVFILMHHPPFSVGTHCGSVSELWDWVALFERYKPSAVFGGHDHAYERLERGGIRYFVTGGGGAPLYTERAGCPEADHDAVRLFRSEHHFLRVRVRGEAIEIEVARPGATPIEVVRYRRGEPLKPAPAKRTVAGARPGWLLPAGALVMLLLVLLWRHRKRATSAP